MTLSFVGSVDADPSIRERLKEEIKGMSLTVEQVAAASGIPKPTLDNILSGRVASMKDTHLSAISVAFPILDIGYVLTGTRNQQVALYRAMLQAIRDKANEGLGE